MWFKSLLCFNVWAWCIILYCIAVDNQNALFMMLYERQQLFYSILLRFILLTRAMRITQTVCQYRIQCV